MSPSRPSDRSVVPKGCLEGTHRAVPPGRTWARVAPLLEAAGITRVADVTGLDRIGIPVALAVRPLSFGLSVAQGKGITLEHARVSAVMESLEQFSAERPSLPIVRATPAEMGPSALDPARLPLAHQSVYRPDRPLEWVEGIDIETGDPRWVPFDLVHADYRVPAVARAPLFHRSTNGLASGNHPAEAVLHALCELVERDAVTLWEIRGPSALQPFLDLDTVEPPVPRDLIERFRRADVDVLAADMTSDVGIPVFGCRILDRDAALEFHPLPPATGTGCHLDPAVALARALTEAAQARLATISGSRDDFFRSRLRRWTSAETLEAWRRFATRAPATGRFDRPDLSSADLATDVAIALERLAAAGLGPAVRVDLTHPDLDVPVVRVVVPGLESVHDQLEYRPGDRAGRARLDAFLLGPS